MRAKFLVFISMIAIFNPIKGQSIGEAALNDWTGNPNRILTEIRLPPPTVTGSLYLNDYWNIGSIKLKSNTILSNYSLKYDLGNNNLEIKDGDSIKICTLRLLDSFYWREVGQPDSVLYVNADRFSLTDYERVIGVLRVISFGKINLYSRSHIEILSPTYNAALNVGDRNKKAVKRRNFYLSRYNNLVEIESKKQLLSYFSDEAIQIENYMRKNKLKIKNEEDLKQIIDFYNSKF